MNFKYFLLLSIALTIVFLSSGITLIGSIHVDSIKEFGKRSKLRGWLADNLLFFITSTKKIRRAWIKMISPPGDE